MPTPLHIYANFSGKNETYVSQKTIIDIVLEKSRKSRQLRENIA